MSRLKQCTLSLVLIALGMVGPGSLQSTQAGRGSSGGSDPTKVSLSSAEVNGLLGGVVRCGRWTVTIPAGAFSGTGTITMAVPERNGLIVDLDIKPGGLNKFLVPVELSCNTSGLNVDPSTLTIYRFDPSTGTWVDEGGVADAGKQTVSVKLSHFSTYKLGKAGW